MSDNGMRWVSCSADFSVTASQTRHLILPGSPTTLCGRTATQAGTWRGNTTKPKCEDCLKVNEPHEPQPVLCQNCGMPITHGEPLFVGGGHYWYHPHNKSQLCVLPQVATPIKP